MLEFKEGYRRGHHCIELSINNVVNSDLSAYDENKKQLIQNIEWHIKYLQNYLDKCKEK